jgi:DNA-binding response OmpR family regulator
MLKSTLWILENTIEQQRQYDGIFSSDYAIRHFHDLAELTAAFEQIRSAGRESSDLPALLLAESVVSDGSFITWLQIRGRDLVLETCPFMVISGFAAFETIQSAFHLGAADFLSKPIEPDELRFKAKRILNLFASEKGALPLTFPVRPNELKLDPVRREVRGANRCTVRLTHKEFSIVQNLYSRPERRMSRSELHRALWPDTTVVSKSLDVHVSHVRRKLSQLHWNIRPFSRDQFVLISEGDHHANQVWIP